MQVELIDAIFCASYLELQRGYIYTVFAPQRSFLPWYVTSVEPGRLIWVYTFSKSQNAKISVSHLLVSFKVAVHLLFLICDTFTVHLIYEFVICFWAIIVFNFCYFQLRLTWYASTFLCPIQGGHIVVAFSVRLSVSLLVSPSVHHKKLVRSVTPTCLNGMCNNLVQMFTLLRRCVLIPQRSRS